MAHVYVVFGESGDYEEKQRWPVRAFARKADAQAERDALDAFAGRLSDEYNRIVALERQGAISFDDFYARNQRLAARLRRRDKGNRESWEMPSYDVESLVFVPANGRHTLRRQEAKG